MAVNMEDAHNQTGANAKKAFMVQPVAEVKKVLKQHWRQYVNMVNAMHFAFYICGKTCA
jgi:hypothetical protein